MAYPRSSAPMPESRPDRPPGALVAVGEALCSCDAEALCLTVLRHQAGWTIDPVLVGPRRLGPLVARVRAALRSVDALRPRAPALGGGQVVLPFESFRPLGAPGSFARRLGAVQVPLGDAPRAAALLAECEGPAWGCPPPLAARLPEGLGPRSPWSRPVLAASLDAWGDEPWAAVLARPLWVPRGQPGDDALQVAAALFWALTRRGFSPSAATPAACRAAPPVVRPSAREQAAEGAQLVRLLNHNAWTALLRAQVEAARLLEVL